MRSNGTLKSVCYPKRSLASLGFRLAKRRRSTLEKTFMRTLAGIDSGGGPLCALFFPLPPTKSSYKTFPLRVPRDAILLHARIRTLSASLVSSPCPQAFSLQMSYPASRMNLRNYQIGSDLFSFTSHRDEPERSMSDFFPPPSLSRPCFYEKLRRCCLRAPASICRP